MSIHPIVRQIIDRDCHVSMTHREVVRHVISKLRDGYRTFRAMPRQERHRLIDDCVKQHRANIELYRAVMTGHKAKTRRTARVPHALVRCPGALSGAELARIMRSHRVTIAELARRLGTTQRRIRQARREGLTDMTVVRDWVEAITGHDPGPMPQRYRITKATEESTCCFCGCPLCIGDAAYEYVSDVFCSRHCCRSSRGWE